MKTKWSYGILFVLVPALSLYLIACGSAGKARETAEIDRISPEQARSKVQAGKALLVCAYSDFTCRKVMLEGALMKSELKQRLPSLSKDQEIIFYCG